MYNYQTLYLVMLLSLDNILTNLLFDKVDLPGFDHDVQELFWSLHGIAASFIRIAYLSRIKFIFLHHRVQIVEIDGHIFLLKAVAFATDVACGTLSDKL